MKSTGKWFTGSPLQRMICGMSLFATALISQGQEGSGSFDFFEPNQSGHSMANSYLLLSASYFVYPNEVGVDDPIQLTRFRDAFEERFDYFGMERYRYFRAESGFIDGLPTDIIDLFAGGEEIHHTDCVVMSNDDAIVVVFRGSLPITGRPTNWITNFSYYQVDVTDQLEAVTDSNLFGTIPLKAHSGFWVAADSIYDEVKQEVAALREVDPRPVFLTGHSLGGALATISALRLHADGIRVQGLYTYAAPRVGDPAFADAFSRSGIPHHRWVRFLDWGPESPAEVMITPSLTNELVLFYKHTAEARPIWRTTGDPHSCLEYAKGIWEDLPYEKRLVFPRWFEDDWEWVTPEEAPSSYDPRMKEGEELFADPDRFTDRVNREYNLELLEKTKSSEESVYLNSTESDPNFLKHEVEEMKYLEKVEKVSEDTNLSTTGDVFLR